MRMDSLPECVLVDYDYDPEFCDQWQNIEQERKEMLYKQEWSPSRITNIGSCEETLKEIYKYMKCSLCLKICPPKSKACAEGHLICPECTKEVMVCPFETTNNFGSFEYCHAGIKHELLVTYDRLAQAIEVPLRCKFQVFGCRKVFQQKQLWTHHLQCQFRPKFSCSFDDCCGSGGAKAGTSTGPQLVRHLIDCHKVPLITASNFGAALSIKREIPLNSEYYAWTLAVLQSHGYNFLLSMTKQRDDGDGTKDRMFIWISMMEDENWDKISFKITPKDSDGVITASWEVGPCQYYKFCSQNGISGTKEDWGKGMDLIEIMPYHVWKKPKIVDNQNSNSHLDQLIKIDVLIQSEQEKNFAYITRSLPKIKY